MVPTATLWPVFGVALVTASHCSALDDSLALSVALLVDQPPDPEPPASPTEPAGPPALAPPAAPPAPSKLPTPITSPADVSAPREPWQLRFGVAVAAGWGVLPAIEPALMLYVKLVPLRRRASVRPRSAGCALTTYCSQGCCIAPPPK